MYESYGAEVQDSLAEQPKPKVKFCFATIFFALFAVGTFFVAQTPISFFAITDGLYSEEGFIFAYTTADVAKVISGNAYFVFAVFLLFKRPNFLVPFFLGIAVILPQLMWVVCSVFLYVNEYSKYISLFDFCDLFFDCLLVAVCALFVAKSPKVKKFAQKTKRMWIIGVPLLPLVWFLFNTADIIEKCFSYKDCIEEQVFTLLAYNTVVYFFEFFTWFLLFSWLADPYKKVKSAKVPAVNPVTYQPNYPQQNLLEPVRQTEIQPPQTFNSVVDEIAKVKRLLDSGAITQEEFEKLKADILNK